MKKFTIPSTAVLQTTDARMELISTTKGPRRITSEQQKAIELNKNLEDLMKEELRRLKTLQPTTKPQPTTEPQTTTLKATTTTLKVTTTSLRPTTSAYCDGELCSKNATCQNINGRKKCVCKDGFIGNGSNCASKSEASI